MPDELISREAMAPFTRWTLLRHTLFALVGIAVMYGVVESLNDYHNTQLVAVAYTVCAAAGLTLLVGLSGQISLGHGAFMAVGAYSTALLLEQWQTSHQNLVLVGVLALSVLITAAFGAVVGLAAARLRGPYLAGATLAFAVGLPQLASYQKLTKHLGGNNGIAIVAPNPPHGFDLYRWQAFFGAIAAIIVLWLCANVSRSRIGRSFRAVRDDEIAASLSGLSVARMQVLAFVISAGCAGLGGGLLAVVSLVTAPGAFPLSLSLGLLAAIVFGGLGSLTGAVLGSVLVAYVLPTWSDNITSALSIHSAKVTNAFPTLIYGLVLMVVMIVFPFGLQGAIRRIASISRSRTPNAASHAS